MGAMKNLAIELDELRDHLEEITDEVVFVNVGPGMAFEHFQIKVPIGSLDVLNEFLGKALAKDRKGGLG